MTEKVAESSFADQTRGFLTPDVWYQHPDPKKAHLWRISGRTDDVVRFSSIQIPFLN